MSFVSRDGDGNILGIFGCLQPGIAEEEMPDDHPDILAYKEEIKVSREAITVVEQILMRLDRIEKLLNFPIEGKLESRIGKLQNCRVRGRGTAV